VDDGWLESGIESQVSSVSSGIPEHNPSHARCLRDDPAYSAACGFANKIQNLVTQSGLEALDRVCPILGIRRSSLGAATDSAGPACPPAGRERARKRTVMIARILLAAARLPDPS
jgi:hypothetical protein